MDTILANFYEELNNESAYDTILKLLKTQAEHMVLRYVHTYYPQFYVPTVVLIQRIKTFAKTINNPKSTEDNKSNNSDIKIKEVTPVQSYIAKTTPSVYDHNVPTLDRYGEHMHMILFGVSNAGKSSWVVTQLCEGYFKDYERFIMVCASNTNQLVSDLATAVYADMVVNRNKDKETLDKDLFRFFHYDNAHSLNFLETLLSQKQDKPTLIFFDDVQINPKVFKLVANRLLGLKNSNITAIVTVHAEVDNDGTAASIRRACQYYVFFNPTEHTVKTVTKEYFDKKVLNQVEYNIRNPKQRVMVLDKLTGNWYLGTQNHEKINTQLTNKHPFDAKNTSGEPAAAERSAI